MFIGLANSEQNDIFNVVHKQDQLTMELKTLELKTIDYQIEEEDAVSKDNDSGLFKVDNPYFNKEQSMTMNDKFIKNFGLPMHTTQTLNIQLTQTIGENPDPNTSQM